MSARLPLSLPSQESVVWALDRMIALRAAGEHARFRVVWYQAGLQRHYRLEIRRADESIERMPNLPALVAAATVEESVCVDPEHPKARGPAGVGRVDVACVRRG